jgi:predicted Zn-dependent peptidase
VVVSLCGAYTPADRQAAEERFSVLAPSGAYSYEPSAYSPRLTATEKDNEQNHFIAAFPALEAGHPDRFALDVMNSIVGAGVSSRLFRRLREEEGLCYSVCSSTATHPHAGFFGVYLATGPRMEERALRLMAEVLRDFARHGPLEEETERAREQIKANVLMSFESTMWCAQHHGQSELLIGKVPAPEEVMASFDAVTSETVRALARKVLDFSALSLSAVGRVSGKDYMSLLT